MHSVTDRQTDGRTDGRTDNRLMPIADHIYCVAVRSAKNDLLYNHENACECIAADLAKKTCACTLYSVYYLGKWHMGI